MSGHSKWANIKHKKASVDAKRGAAFTKVGRLLTVAAKKGGGDPEMNPSLRLAVEKAKAVNMPKDRIEKAILKGAGGGENENYEELVYEGYGQGGVAIMAEALTDNRNRTTPEIRKIFEKGGGNLGEMGCVNWMFHRKGSIEFDLGDRDEDAWTELAIEVGAEDVQLSEMAILITDIEGFEDVLKATRAMGLEPKSAELIYAPENLISVDAETARKLLKIMDAIEEHDDIQTVTSNMDISEEVQRELENDE